GIRRCKRTRSILSREHATVQTPFGSIRVKVGRRGGEVLQVWPEYEDCVEAAQRGGATLSAVQSAALQAWKNT
ncbi:MAG: DUF111 family protein, partial [Planctomycetes bacterium]|nr:DUF111 family protein [Planctomycetota bacterium]